MQIHRFEDPKTFLERVDSFLLAHEAENNLIYGLASVLVQTPYRYGTEFPYLATVEEDGRVLLAALQTPPHNLILSLTGDQEAMELLVRDTLQTNPALPGVNGPALTSKSFVAKRQYLTGQSYYKGMSMRIYRLDRVNPVTGVSGQARPAAEADFSRLVDWIAAFSAEATQQEIDASQAQNTLKRYLSTPNSGIWVWEDGEVVSMSGYARSTPNGISISLVYTPPEQRRHGYAGACVAALSQYLLDSGKKFCTLYTNLSNPTSNHIYQQIGYYPICDADEYRFDER